MTKLTYIVGNEEVISYKIAKILAAETGLPVIPKYTKIEEEFAVAPGRLAKVQEYFAKRRAEREVTT